MSSGYASTFLDDISDKSCFYCDKTPKKNLKNCNGCGEYACSSCLKFGEVCGNCYQHDIDHMIQIHKELRLVYRFWISIMIGCVLQAPFSVLIILSEVSNFVSLSVDSMDIVYDLFAIIIGVFLISYPGYLYFIRKVEPYDERMEMLENYERLYGKIKVVLGEDTD